MAYEYTRENNLWEDVCYLIKKDKAYDENGVETTPIITRREVFCLVGGIYEKEYYNAQQSGIKAQCKVIVPMVDYEDEVLVEYGGKQYSVYRKYPINDTYELYLREDVGTW